MAEKSRPLPAIAALDQASLGAWVIKSRFEASLLDHWMSTAFADVTTRCVRASYRTALVAAGQPVLLWISGQDRERPAGIYAQGRTTGAVGTDPGGDSSRPGAQAQPVMPVALEPVTPPVLRREILGHPVLSRIEVVRMPAGSNPSFLDRTQLHALREAWPHLCPA